MVGGYAVSAVQNGCWNSFESTRSFRPFPVVYLYWESGSGFD